MKRRVAIGLAPGKTADNFGLAVMEMIKTPIPPFGTGRPEYRVILLESFPPGTDYEPIYARLRKILAEDDAKKAGFRAAQQPAAKKTKADVKK